MDEVLQRALKELERAGHRLVLRPPARVIQIMRHTAGQFPGGELAQWLEESGIGKGGCAICDEGGDVPLHGCIGYSGPTGFTGPPGPPASPHIHPSQAFPAQPKKEPLIRTFADQRRVKPQQQFKPKLRRRP